MANIHINTFNTGLIDSLKIRVKLDKVEILDKRLITEFIAYYPSLQSLDNDGTENGQEKLGDEYKRAEPFTKIINGITYRFYIKAFIDSQKTAHEYVVFQLSAKMLKEQYFEGITLSNIDMILNDINSFGVLKISKFALLQGLVSDIDICINQLIDLDSLKTAFAFIMQNPNSGKKPLIHYINQSNKVKNTFNLGMDFNKREKATNTTPYCKIYHKGFELQSKSNVFYKAYLQPKKVNHYHNTQLNNFVRYEFTIKAHKHKEYLVKKGFKADFKTLNDLLNTCPNDLLLIAKSGLKHYIEDKEKVKIESLQSPTDIMLQFYQAQLILLGFDKEKLLGFEYFIDCPVAKSRSKTKAKKLIDDLMHQSKNIKDKLEQNSKSEQFLKNLGL
jgi:hypothetical protein